LFAERSDSGYGLTQQCLPEEPVWALQKASATRQTQAGAAKLKAITINQLAKGTSVMLPQQPVTAYETLLTLVHHPRHASMQVFFHYHR